MKHFLILITCFIFIENLKAQNLQYGAELGINLSGATVKDPGGDPHGTPGVGFQLGGFGEYALTSPHLAVGARVLFSYEGYKPVIYDTKASVHVSFIKIPINLIYKSGGKNGKLSIGVGPYFAFGVGGHYTSDNTNEKIKIHFGSNPDEDDLKRVDIGVDLMACYKLNDKICVRASFDLGAINYLTPGSTADASAHCLSFGITGCYSLSK
ncbi:MAG TPA: outer membrane beta-barrel protein [Puia sp.]|nr:outer membrane beta-barrel protein [Puia sp.]